MALGLKRVTNSSCCFAERILPFDLFQRIDLLPFLLATLQFAVIALEMSLVWVAEKDFS